jgi:phosphoglycolate phosphatase
MSRKIWSNLDPLKRKRGYMRAEAVIFDFDGTLVHLNIDFKLMRQEVEGLLAEYGLDLESLKGLLILEMIDEATRLLSKHDPLKGQELHDKARELVTEHEIRAAKNGRVFPGVIEMFGVLNKRGMRIGVITRNCETAVKMVFPNIERFCHVFIPRDNITHVKPHPDHLSAALKEMAVSKPDRCVMIGDHPMDIEGGRRMAMKTIGVLTGRTGRNEFLEAGADLVLDSVTEIPDYLF